MDAHSHESPPTRVKVDKARRIVIPAPICKRLDINPGDELTLEADDKGVHLATVDHAVRALQELCAPFVVPGESIVDKLIAERRAEAARE